MSSVKRSQLAKAFVGLIGKYPTPRLVVVLARLVINNKLTGQVDLLVSDINQEISKRYGQLEAKVRTVHPLNDEVKQQLQQLIKSQTGSREVKLDIEEDKSLIGGLIASTPELEIDLSIKSKLRSIKV